MLISKFNNQNIEEKLNNLQYQYQITLPEQYKNFLSKYNGGETPNSSFDLAGVSSDIRGFFGLGISNANFQFESNFTDEDILTFISENMFPIGCNSFDDLFFIGINHDDIGSVFFLYHDRIKHYIKLANSFEDFISKCESEKVKPCLSIEERIAKRKESGKFDDPNPMLIQAWQNEIDHYRTIHQEEVIL